MGAYTLDDLTKILITATATAVCTFIANYLFNNMTEKNEKKQKKAALLHSILAEIDTLIYLINDRSEQIYSEYNKLINAVPIKYFFYYFPIKGNYFVVFDSSAANLGNIHNNQLIMQIIKTYSETKGFFDNLKDFENISIEGRKIQGNKSTYEQLLKSVELHKLYADQLLNEFAPFILSELKKCKAAIENEIRDIDQQDSLVLKKNPFGR